MIDLEPSDMQSVLSHDFAYKRAAKLLLENWEPEGNGLFSDHVKDSDVVFARKLQRANLIHGDKDLDKYKDVHRFVVEHGQWLTHAAQVELLRPFE